MELRYADRALERVCTDSRQMQRKLGPQVAKALRLRITELVRVETITDLLLVTGRWEQLTADRSGQWSARLSRNWRLIVEPDGPELVAVVVVEIIDYH